MARRSNGTQNLQRTDPTGIDVTVAFTMMLSVYVDGLATGNQGLFALGDASVDTARGFNIITRTDGRLDFRFLGGVSLDSAAGVIVDDTWARIVVTYDPADSDRIRVGVNGTQVRQNVADPIGALTAGDVIAFMTAGSVIADPVTGAVAGFGWLDGIALSIADADALAQDLCDALVSYPTETQALYLFQNAAPGADISGVGNTLTNNGTTDETDPAWVPASCTLGPNISAQPANATAVVNDSAGNTATFSVTASGVGTLLYDWELETSVGGGVYANLANGSGATWTGQASASCVGTFTANTLNGRRIRCNITDDNGTVTSATALLTVLTGDVITQPVGTTNGSGVITGSMVSNAPGLTRLTAVGEVTLDSVVVITKR